MIPVFLIKKACKPFRFLFRYTLLLIAALLWLFPAVAQERASEDAVREFREIYRQFKDHQAFKIKMTMGYFEDSASDKPVEEMQGAMYRKQGQLYANMSGQEQIRNEEHLIRVDHQSRRIRVTEQDEESTEQQENGYEAMMPFGSLDSLARLFTTVRHDHLGDNRKAYYLQWPNNRFRGIYYVYEPERKVPHRVELYLYQGVSGSRGGKVVVAYEDITFQPSFNKDFFASQNYVQKNRNGQYRPAADYENYQVVQ